MKIIPEKCKKCLECAEVCPVGAISKKDGVVVIDQSVCLSCGCCASACTSDAISYED
ncbi:MAG: 4Fe-4S binding protein [Alphaproteobacteria bacterium]|nr:4Fe-4S binding protein [Alphaproteobacteria bacterium]